MLQFVVAPRYADVTRRSALAAAVFVIIGCRAPLPEDAPRTSVRFTTGLPGMTFKPLGEALAAAYGTVLPTISMQLVETPGSVTNIEQLQSGGAELGLALADVAYMAFNGHIPELRTPAPDIRAIAVLHPSVVHVLVPKDSTVQTISDLRGRRIGIGPQGSGTAVTSALLLRAFGVAPGDVRPRTASFLDATEALARNELDALFIVAADPVDVVRRATRGGARLVDIKGATVEQLRAEYPFLRPAVIKSNTYPGHPQQVQTVRDDVLLLCRVGLDDGVVYRLTSALFEALPSLASERDYLRLMDVRRAPATPVPLHPGAALYYREQELSR